MSSEEAAGVHDGDDYEAAADDPPAEEWSPDQFQFALRCFDLELSLCLRPRQQRELAPFWLLLLYFAGLSGGCKYWIRCTA